MGKVGKCRSKSGREKIEWEGGYIQGHGIRKVWGQSSPVCPLLSVQMALRKWPMPLGAPPHPPSSASEPSPFPVQYSLAPEPGARCSPHPGWPEECSGEDGKKAHNTPGGKETLPFHLWGCRLSWCQRSEGWGWETPFVSASSPSSHPAFSIIPLQKLPSNPSISPETST